MQSTTPTDTKRALVPPILSACLKPVVRDRPHVADISLMSFVSGRPNLAALERNCVGRSIVDSALARKLIESRMETATSEGIRIVVQHKMRTAWRSDCGDPHFGVFALLLQSVPKRRAVAVRLQGALPAEFRVSPQSHEPALPGASPGQAGEFRLERAARVSTR